LAAIDGTVTCDAYAGPVDRERLQDVLEGHAVVGLLPHLLGQVEMALGGVHVRIDAEGERLVDE
jgi:hypothetical protein